MTPTSASSAAIAVCSYENRPAQMPGRESFGLPADVRDSVRNILDEVRTGGDGAVRRFTERFDGVRVDEFQVSAHEIEDAYTKVDQPFLDAIRHSIAAVRAFHQTQLPSEEVVETTLGVRAWRVWRPLERVGLYVPGGRARYPSSVVMLAIPAAIAGCPERILMSPPGPDGTLPAATVVAAAEAGVTDMLKIGGAQAIAAMAYGTESIRRVDKIFGPGNAYVTAAKLAVFPEVAIDVPAGPSELMIIADANAEPEYIAADMLANAEHGPDSPVTLISSSKALIDAALAALECQLSVLPRRAIATQALSDFGLCIQVATMDQATEIANEYAPEHLQIMTVDPASVLDSVRHAGSVFIGSNSPNAAGDYASGTNHVLPTGGFARSFPPLATEAFGKAMQVQELDVQGIKNVMPTVGALARAEGLDGHARAVEIRCRNQDATDRAV